MSFNMTNVTRLTSSPTYHLAHGNVSAQRVSISTDTANNLGYGVGRLILGAFDGLWNTWQTMWTPEPIEVAERRNYMIYKDGLGECVKLLGPALAKLQMNPKDRFALKKVEQLSGHFARYLEPSNEENLRQLQSKILKPLEERVSTTAHLNIKNALSKCMPVFFQRNSPMSEKAQTVLQLAQARRSQVMQEFPGAKIKPLQENDFVMADSAETDNGYYYSGQLNDVRNVFSYLDAGLSKLFTIFPGVSAQTNAPTYVPPTKAPPTKAPTSAPTTGAPTSFPTITPTIAPTSVPTTGAPTSAPILPTESPTSFPTITPTIAPTSVPTTGNSTGLIIGLSCGAGFIVLLGVGGCLTFRWLKKEERPSELNRLINPLSTQQKMILI